MPTSDRLTPSVTLLMTIDAATLSSPHVPRILIEYLTHLEPSLTLDKQQQSSVALRRPFLSFYSMDSIHSFNTRLS